VSNHTNITQYIFCHVLPEMKKEAAYAIYHAFAEAEASEQKKEKLLRVSKLLLRVAADINRKNTGETPRHNNLRRNFNQP